MGPKELCLGVPQNTVRGVKCPGFFQFIKILLSDHTSECFDFSTAGENICRSRTTINFPPTAGNRKGRVNVLIDDCAGWGTDVLRKISEWTECLISVPLIIIVSLLGSLAKLRKATSSFLMSACPCVRMRQLGSRWTDFHEILYKYFRKSAEKIQFSLKSDKNYRHFTWRHAFLITPHLILLRMINVSGNSFGGNQNTHFVFSNSPPPPENHAVCEIMWKNTVEPDRLQMTIWRTRIACWITKATNAQSQYVILIALLLQQWLHAIASMLRHTYIACLVSVCKW